MAGTVLITGAARRIGRALALGLARRGWDIALHYHRSRQEAESAAEQVRQAGRMCELFPADLSDPQAVRTLIPRVFEKCPHCRVLINNASIFERAPLVETTEDLFDRHFAVNFRAPLFLSKDFAARCGEGGQIVNLLDAKIERTFTPYFAYALSKKALAAFTELAARELAPRVRVNGVCPGLILPPEGEGPEYLARLAKKIPAGRAGAVDDVVQAVLFLLENEFVTGQILFADGGEHLG
ncbi:MAG TPA: SDR family oxidoreductase [Phycisphaerae bacterium]|nr:SDR family oxidoreductase [Phycisphaerae bacterium]